MPVVGTTVTVDLHVTGEADVDAIRSAVQDDGRAHPRLAQTLREAVEAPLRKVREKDRLSALDLSVEVDLVTGQVPGSPRARLHVHADMDGEREAIAKLDEAVSPPIRASVADEVEQATFSYLMDHDLGEVVRPTVSVTPVAFR